MTSQASRYLGDYKCFAPRKLTLDEVILMRIKGKQVPESAETAEDRVIIRSLSRHDLVRFRLCSRALQDACAELGHKDEPLYHDADAASIVARLGLVDRTTGRMEAILQAIDAHAGYPAGVADVMLPKDRAVDADALREALQEIGLPPGRKTGCDHRLAERADLWFEGGVWIRKEPRSFVAVTFERICFCVSPTMSETVDVLVSYDPDLPLDGNGDSDAAYRTKRMYVNDGFDRLHDLGYGVRPGFSSWLQRGDLRLVKVIGRGIENEIEELDTQTSPSP